MTWIRISTVVLLAVLAAPSVAQGGDCQLRNGPMTIFPSGTLKKVYALGKENYAAAISLYAACASVPVGTKIGVDDGGFFTSTVIVKEGWHLGCAGDLENEFIKCDFVASDEVSHGEWTADQESAYRQFLKEFDAGAACPRLFELRKKFRVPFQESPQEKEANTKLRSVGCLHMEATRKKQTEKDAAFTVQEYRMYRALIDTPMSISESKAIVQIAGRFRVSTARVEQAAKKVQRILVEKNWFSTPGAELRHASDWAGEER